MLIRLCFTLLTALIALGPSSARAVDESDLLPIEEAFALSTTATSRDSIDIQWQIADGYYLYRHRTAVEVVDGGFKANPLDLPDGERYTDEFFGEVETYRGQLQARLSGAAADDAKVITLRIRYQGCADIGVCYPPHSEIREVALPPATALLAPASAPLGLPALTPPIGGASVIDALQPGAAAVEAAPLPDAEAFRFEAIASSPSVLLLRFKPAPGYYLYRDRSSFRLLGDAARTLAPQWPPAQSHFDEHFGDVAVYFDEVEVPLPLERRDAAASTLTLEATFQGCQTDGICYPPMTRTIAIDLPAVSDGSTVAAGGGAQDTSALSVGTILWALLLAAIGGLILNLMPCVLPVLSLKAISLAEGGREGARRSASWYTLGVVLSFVAVGGLALALRSAGLALGWGFQLQQPLIIAALAYVMFAVGLSLSGLFQIGAHLAGSGQSLTERKGPAGDFFTGVLAVVVASPCTAPFMGPALVYAFAVPPLLSLAVFAALGFGLALPFLLIGWIPALASRLPRPGAWMNTFKQVMAFPMYLTAAWLISILAAQRGSDGVLYALIGAVVLALGLWWREHLRFSESRVAKGFALMVLLLSLLPLYAIHRLPAAGAVVAAQEGVVAYSADALARLRAEGRVVFTNMTADWCVSCKVNEKAVLSQAAFERALAEANAVYMRGDWTNVDSEITAFLESHKAVGVPLYVVYPANGGEGEVLPTILTAGIVEEALARASGE